MRVTSKFYNHLANDSLYRNSIYLMLGAAVMAVLGFFFWVINARLYSTDQVGIATTLISVVTLISSFSLLGLDNGIVRYLPTSGSKNQKINTSFTFVASISALMALIYLISLNISSPKLLFVRDNIFYAILFVLFMVFSTLNTISESVFIAYRSAKYILVKNTISSLVKLVLPIFLISLGAYGIFASVGISIVIASISSLIFLIAKFNYLVEPTISKEVVRRMTRFSLGSYLAGSIGGLPAMVLPLVILNNLGAKLAAYFYMDMTIASLLYIIPMATSQSLFAEGSYSETELKGLLLKAINMNFVILVPAIIATFLFGKYILLAFGGQYSSEGFVLLQILAISGIFLSVNYMANSIFYIRHRIGSIILVNFIGVSIILSLSTILIHRNLLGIGVAWVTGYGAMTLIYLFLLKRLLWQK
jgi:O-antigen/teichoic acid export membrane protein